MTGNRRVVEAGDAALVLQLGNPDARPPDAYDPDVNREAIGIADDIRARQVRGVVDVLPTYRSVAVYFDPLATDVEALRQMLRSSEAPAREEPSSTIDVPVLYGGAAGPDLDEVAKFAGCDPETVIRRHSERTYRVFMLGFLPGFPYMALVDESIAAPRRSSPRQRVAAGSIGIAGCQTGIYPSDSPGGWQIIGRTAVTLFDPHRNPPALLKPGDRVRFVRTNDLQRGTNPQVRTRHEALGTTHRPRAGATVLKPGLLTTIQDSGRWGHQSLGVPPAGPMDSVAHGEANRLVGNAATAATLEVTLVGPEIRIEEPVRVGIAGADLSATVNRVSVGPGTAIDCPTGSVLAFGARKSGARTYVGFAGGIDIEPLLGSRATHIASGMGGLDGRSVRAGDVFAVGCDFSSRGPRGLAPTAGKGPGVPSSGGARLRVMPGPQLDRFDEPALAALECSRFIISPQSNRMGYRLTGGRLAINRGGDMLSDAAFTGAVQVPPSGEPILLMADRQTTGGYPQIAVVISADVPVAGQLLPGDWVEFEWCTREDAITALRQRRHAG